LAQSAREHHDAAGSSSQLEDGAEEMVGAEVRTPRAARLDDVAASTLRPFSLSFSMPKKLFIGLERPVRQEFFQLQIVGEFGEQLRIA